MSLRDQTYKYFSFHIINNIKFTLFDIQTIKQMIFLKYQNKLM
jgi:hypothetical protein